jgi:hypothetical protein
MSAFSPARTPPDYADADISRSEGLSRHQRRSAHAGRRLFLVCALQAILSLTLVWSNTAYIDEADYLWVGHLEIAHWLHHVPWPAGYAENIFSGSPLIYPPIGALADSVGGLAAARVLSLLFMIGATALLYQTALRITSPRAALIAAALFASSEPAIRLAFATYDPLSIFLTALAAWLVVQASFRKRRLLLLTAGAFALGVSNATAYSGIVIDPIVIAMAFCLWRPWVRGRRAIAQAAALAAGTAAVFAILMTLSHSWPGLAYTVVSRNVSDYQAPAAILSETLEYSGLVMVLAFVAIVAAAKTEARAYAGLLIVLACAAFVVPAAQLHDQTAWSIDKHLAYGIWFASIAAGYLCSQLIEWLPRGSVRVVVLCSVIGLAYAGGTSWQTAWQRYHAWPNAEAFVTSFRPLAARATGPILIAGHEANIPEYYTPQGGQWRRWVTTSLDPANHPAADWRADYIRQLDTGKYGLVALFYTTSFSTAPELPSRLMVQPYSKASRELLSLVGTNAGEPGLPVLTEILLADHGYTLAAYGPYNSAHDQGLFVIWQRVSTP